MTKNEFLKAKILGCQGFPEIQGPHMILSRHWGHWFIPRLEINARPTDLSSVEGVKTTIFKYLERESLAWRSCGREYSAAFSS